LRTRRHPNGTRHTRHQQHGKQRDCTTSETPHSQAVLREVFSATVRRVGVAGRIDFRKM
jgi:hypothetical protein